MNEKQLDKILTLVGRGDNNAFSLLYTATSKGVYAFLYTYYGNRHDTEDALQSVFLKIKLNACKYKPKTNAKAWILQVAKNYAFNDLTRKKRETSMDNETLSVIAGEDKGYDGSVFEAINKCLNEGEKQVVILHVLWGYKHREISAILNMPTGTVTSKYKTSIKKLKEFLEGGKV